MRPITCVDYDVIVVGATGENLLVTDDHLGLNPEDETSTESYPRSAALASSDKHLRKITVYNLAFEWHQTRPT